MTAATLWFGCEPANIKNTADSHYDSCRNALIKNCANGKAPKLENALTSNNSLGRFLCATMTLSPYLRGMILRFSSDLEELFQTPIHERIDALISQIEQFNASSTVLSEAALMTMLRNVKSQTHMLIGLGDIAQIFTVEQTTTYLSRLADACLSAALNWLLVDAAKTGKITLEDMKNPSFQSGIIVLGMGKMGAYELNYSSDIDIIVCFDPSASGLSFASEQDPTEVMSRLVRRLVRIMQERTGEGYVFRTDLRLRPDPGATPLAINVDAALTYYESRGQNWERAAFIKARPVAGDMEAGTQFLADLRPFIWRKYLDYAAISDVQSIKRQIHAHKGHGKIALLGHNVKLGRGGIREIEFFVQTQQLIAGGRAPELRETQTVKMLNRLAGSGWINDVARDELSAAYNFLRRTEHALQIIADEQTHTLPKTIDELNVVALLLGYQSHDLFSEELMKTFHQVEQHFGDLFEDDETLENISGNLVFTGDEADPSTLETLTQMGFVRSQDIWNIIRTWHFGRYKCLQSEKAREQLTAMLPQLLESFSNSGRADEVILRFDSLLSALPTGAQLFSMLNSNRQLLALLTKILSAAPRLADIITKRPLIFAGMLEPDFFERLPSEQQLKEKLDSFISEADGYEDRLDRMRIFAAEQRFLIGIRFLTGSIDADTMGVSLSHLAEMLLSIALNNAAEDVAQKHGKIDQGRMCLLAMGRLGSCEMTAGSDVDLLLIYDADENQYSNGEKPLAPSQYFARITQRLISALSAPTAEGVLYEVDFRLRPSGNKGPLATSLRAFAKYQRDDAWTWEQMALTRAKAICGDNSLRKDVESEREQILKSPRDIEKTRADIADMRKRLMLEKGAKSVWDIKMSNGGILDIEFMAQFWALTILPNCKHGLTNCKLNARSAKDILPLLNEETLNQNDQDFLNQALDDFTTVNHLIRLCSAGDFDPETAAPGLVEQLCMALDLPDIATLKLHIAEQQNGVAKIFGRVIASN